MRRTNRLWIIIGLVLVAAVVTIIIVVVNTSSRQPYRPADLGRNEEKDSRLPWEVDLLSPAFYVDFEAKTGIQPVKALNLIGDDGHFNALLFENAEQAHVVVEMMLADFQNDSTIETRSIKQREVMLILGDTGTGGLYVEDSLLLLIPTGLDDASALESFLSDMINDSTLQDIRAALEQAPQLFPDEIVLQDNVSIEEKDDRNNTAAPTASVVSTPIPTVHDVSVPSNVEEKDLGIVPYTQTPMVRIIHFQEMPHKVEIAFYHNDKDEIHQYLGQDAALHVNNQRVWASLGFNEADEMIYYDHLLEEEVTQSQGYGAYLDITVYIRTGSNMINYDHRTSTGSIGVRLRITYETPPDS